MQKKTQTIPAGRETLENLIIFAEAFRKLAGAGVRIEIRCSADGHLNVAAGDYEYVQPVGYPGCYKYYPINKDLSEWRDVEPEEIGSLTEPPIEKGPDVLGNAQGQ